MSKACLLLFLGRKKKKPIWPNCEPIEVCKHSVKTCSNKCSCQILQPGLLLDVPLPTGPQDGTLSLPSPRDSGEKAAVPPRLLPAELSPGASPSLLLGAGYVPPAPARIRPVMQGLRWSCPVPSHRPWCDGIIRTWDRSLFLPPPVTVPQTYSHYHP